MRSVIIQKPSAFVKFLDMVRGNKGVRWSRRSVFCLTVLIEEALWVMESLISTWSTEPPPPLRHGRLYKTSDGHAMAKMFHLNQFTSWFTLKKNPHQDWMQANNISAILIKYHRINKKITPLTWSKRFKTHMRSNIPPACIIPSDYDPYTSAIMTHITLNAYVPLSLEGLK